ncbi:MAG: DNA-binding protein [Methylocystis sp.]|nr:DNA-binding protein [Methylocystis sp.]
MPKKATIEKARNAKREGKAPTTQAGEFVHEEIEKIRRGEHGARSPQQAIAIGLSEARRAGVDLPPPKKGKAKESTRKSAEYAYEAGQGERETKRRPRVSRAVSKVLEHEPKSAASHEALSRQAKRAAARRSSEERAAAAEKAAETKGPSRRSAAARKAAQTKGARGRKEAAQKAAKTRARRA